MTAAAMTQSPPEELEALAESLPLSAEQSSRWILLTVRALLSELKRIGEDPLCSAQRQDVEQVREALAHLPLRLGSGGFPSKHYLGSLQTVLYWWDRTYNHYDFHDP